MHERTTPHYSLVCPVCDCRVVDDGRILDCPNSHPAGLLKTDYLEKTFEPSDEYSGIYRYHKWLPISRTFPDTSRPIVYRSDRLASLLGLRELWIAFNGYWPQMGATLDTATFKEFEAYTVLSRLQHNKERLVVTSAGNTAAAFATLCSRHQIPVLIIVPAAALKNIKVHEPLHPCVKVIAIEAADYYDAISLGDAVSDLPGFHSEGGTRNVGRRDGLGTVLLSAVESIGGLPDYYFQAIGSGAGAIATHEAASRIRQASGSTERLPRLMLAQNSPFTPVLRAWRSGRRTTVPSSEDQDRLEISQVCAPELTNRRPPYSLRGGLHDALIESSGDVFAISNSSAQDATRAFYEVEGIDIEPASGVAVASLRSAVMSGKVDRHARVLLNITGGGRAQMARKFDLEQVTPDLIVQRHELQPSESLARVLGDISELLN
ncbi:cysteate synthase [Streptomyces sp. NPDC048208]|uniref:cysteate synthase n=1 Tax=Streptomyces sp. NPDC048208 TaxID=3365515 RepID=UPI003713CB01